MSISHKKKIGKEFANKPIHTTFILSFEKNQF